MNTIMEKEWAKDGDDEIIYKQSNPEDLDIFKKNE